MRVRLQSHYSSYVTNKYSERFGDPHVVPDVVQHVAEVMTSLYPSLRDEHSDPDNPTFVSTCIINILIGTVTLKIFIDKNFRRAN